ncbi:hypothetical protein BDP81DRAFT_455423 [Colletotrichum phormii]|uniref:Uncharacterized protein n=1 Tax=Colletotrichum phormii TaxID=359342 RepID=A0AAI9ZD89_9PEZI|nr:uncharacterized protein BDP81DRAFT_455423 [Colletotrichum phormii]KAK1622407.1 hypothetical protein BDP81DRAFT_455423 [Colletotrichum phormii]
MPLNAVRVPEDHGPNYFGEIKAFHDLHCLTIISQRQKCGSFEMTIESSKCMLLMCTPSLDVLPWVWVNSRAWTQKKERKPSIIANFKTRHMCRDFGAIRDWYLRQQDDKLKSVQLVLQIVPKGNYVFNLSLGAAGLPETVLWSSLERNSASISYRLPRSDDVIHDGKEFP